MEELIAALQDHTTALRENTAAVQLYMAEKERKPKDWINPEEAAQVVGIPITSSGYHRRRLSNAARRFGLRIQPGRPPSYWRKDIEELNQRIKDGKAVI